MMLRSLKSTKHGTTFRLHQDAPPVFSFFFLFLSVFDFTDQFQHCQDGVQRTAAALEKAACFILFLFVFFFFAFSAQEMPLCYKIPPISVCVCVFTASLCLPNVFHGK